MEQRAGRMHEWLQRAQLPLLTVAVLTVLTLIPWVNAALNRYRFNVALALIASVPVAIVLVRGVAKARAAVSHSTA